MIVVMKSQASEEQKTKVKERLISLGFDIHQSTGVNQTIFGAIGEPDGQITEMLISMVGVQHAYQVSVPFKLASRSFRPERTVIELPGGGKIGGNEGLLVMAGPCSIESHDGFFEAARAVKNAGAKVLRGGAFKPRTSPYSFQGMGEEGLSILQEAGKSFDMATVSEVMDTRHVDLVANYVDILQVGTRNMHNFSLLREVGKSAKPVLLKRGLAGTIEEWIMAAEYIMSEGNYAVILCERGIRTYEPWTRNTLDVSAIPLVQEKTHLPVIADPSHAVGYRDKVTPVARAAVAVGADGLMIEVHPDPENAMSDGPQSLYPDQFQILMNECSQIAKTLGRQNQ